MKNILIISWHFPPRNSVGAIRVIKFCKHLRKLDWNPIVISVKLGDDKKKESIDGVNVYRAEKREGLLNKLDYYFSKVLTQSLGNNGSPLVLFGPDDKYTWVNPSINLIKNIIKEEKIDVVYSNSPPHSCSIIGEIVKKRFNIPFVLDYRDEWTLTPEKKSFFFKLQERMEAGFISAADYVIFNTKPVEFSYRKKYGLKNTSTIPNSFPSEVKQVKRLNKKEFIIFCSGVMGEERNPSLLFKAIKKLNKPDIKFFYAGSKENFDYVKKIAKQEGVLDKCVLNEFMPQKELIRIMYKSSLLFLPQTETLYMAVASKAYEYLRSGIPILVYYSNSPLGKEWIKKREDHETTKIIKKYSPNSYFVLNDSLKEMESAVSDTYNKWNKGRLKTHVSKEFLKKYDETAITKQLTDVLNFVAGKGKTL